ncbi:MAG: hypothetical protein ABFR62_05825 [Bacteroidota bacterium]
MKTIVVIPAILLLGFLFNADLVAQTGKVKTGSMTDVDSVYHKTVATDDMKVVIGFPINPDEANIIPSPLYILNGEIMENMDARNIKSDDIESIEVLKNEYATKKYGSKGINGVMKITLKDEADMTQYTKEKLCKPYVSESKPLYLVNGKRYEGEGFPPVKREDIESVSVLKGEDAVKKYGERANDGAVEIYTFKDEESKRKSQEKIRKLKAEAEKKGATSIIYTDDIPEEYRNENYLKNMTKSLNTKLYVIDGKESTVKEAEKLLMDDIYAIEIYDIEEKAVKKFGEKGKNGVVNIVLK